MKILIVHNEYQQPGGEDVVFEQERQLLERAGHDVITYTRSNRELPAARSIVDELALVRNTVWATDTRREIAVLLKRERPHVVHVHNTFVVISPSIYSACREAGVPVVQTLHNYRLFCPSATFFREGGVCEECVDRSVLESVRHGCYRNSRTATAAIALMLVSHRWRHTWRDDVSHFIALTQFARDRFIRAGLSASKISVKPNFVDPDPGTDEKEAGKYALFVGRLSPEKRVSTLLKAWARVRGIPLVVVGGGPEHARLQVEANLMGLKDVRFTGFLPRDETLKAMRNARFLVFSSEWYENFPVTIAESFACGLPVICSGLGAMAEIVTHGVTGLHFKVGDDSDLASTAVWAWENPELMRMMGKQARNEYKEKYTAEQNYPLLMQIYRKAIESMNSGWIEDAVPDLAR